MSLKELLICSVLAAEINDTDRRNSYKCSMRNWHRHMDRSPRCRQDNGRKVCDCEEFYVWPLGTFGRKVKVAFPSHFDKYTDRGFPVVINYHGTNMDPITAFSEALENDIEYSYVGRTKVDVTEALLKMGYVVVAPGKVTDNHQLYRN